MAEVTVYDATRMKEIEDGTVVNGGINPVTGHLELTRHDTSVIDAGLVNVSPRIVTSATRPVAPNLFEGLVIYETDTDRFWFWNGSAWVARGTGTYICTSATRPGHFNGLSIYETDTERTYRSNGSVWKYQSGGTDPLACYMYHTGGQLLVVGANTIVAFNTEAYDNGNNAAAGRYTCPETTVYSFFARASASAVSGERFTCGIYKNAGEAIRGTDWTSGATIRSEFMVSGLIPCIAGEVMDFRVNQVSGTARTTDAGIAQCYMMIGRA